MAIPFTPTIAKLPTTVPFVGPETLERSRGKPFALRIGANESAWGMSPRALEAMHGALSNSRYYADPESYKLRQALAEKHGVEPHNICVDAGIDTLLGLLVRTLINPGDAVVSSYGGYPTFNYHVAGFSGVLHTVPYRGFHEDPDALLEKTKQLRQPLLYLANPDNPMGTRHCAEVIQKFIDQLPSGTVLALDEAYIEFAPPHTAPAIDCSNPQVVRFRTFSKAWGMAGQRIGYAIAHPELIAGLNKIRNHFGLNRVAQVGAYESLQDPDFLQQVIRLNGEARERTMALAAKHQLYAEPSSTNFVAVDMGNSSRAAAMISALAERNVFMRMPNTEPLNSCIRVGMCTEAQYDFFAIAFEQALDETSSCKVSER